MKVLAFGAAVELAKFFIKSNDFRHGAHKVMITDRGSAFLARLIQEILCLSHSRRRRMTAYHPQTNGLTEKLNKPIADIIFIYVDMKHII